MAAVVQTQSGDWDDAATWDTGVPGAADAVTSSAAFALTVNVDTAALGSFLRSAGGEALQIDNTKSVDVDGSVLLDGLITGQGAIEVEGGCTFSAGMPDLPSTITVTLNGAGAQALETNAVSIGALVIDCTDVVTAQNAIAASSFLMGNAASTYVDGDFAHNIAGDLLISAGSRAGVGEWKQTGDGDLENPASGSVFTKLILDAAAVTTGVVHTEALGGSGTISSAAPATNYIFFYAPVDNFWSFTGTCNVKLRLSVWNISRSSGGSITVVDQDFDCAITPGETLTMDGDLKLGTGDLLVYCSSAGIGLLDMDKSGLQCDVAALGITGHADRDGGIALGVGSHKIGSLKMATGGGSDGNTVDFGSSYIELSGTIDGNGLVVTADEGACHIQGGTIDDVDSANWIHTHGSADVGVNVKVSFDTAATPGSRMLVGAGV